MAQKEPVKTVNSHDLAPAPSAEAGPLAIIGPQIAALTEAFRVNMPNERIGFFQLERLKVPAGGATTWEYEGGDGLVSARELQGIVVSVQPARTYYIGDTVESRPPNCSSTDAVSGYGHRGLPNDTDGGGPYPCDTCVYGGDRFASPCKRREMQLVLVEGGGPLPFFLNLPPTRLGNSQKFRMSVSKLATPDRVVPYWHVIAILGLEKDANAKGIFARVTFKRVAVLSPADAAKIDAYKAALDNLLRTVRPAEAFAPPAESAPSA